MDDIEIILGDDTPEATLRPLFERSDGRRVRHVQYGFGEEQPTLRRENLMLYAIPRSSRGRPASALSRASIFQKWPRNPPLFH
ncbi:hypothetical protein [Trinickia symbiotica]|uniref:hypothetical protein n=1 Tax=Trinickia symbiotica TaxID=863227 RepID=UPI0011AFBECC|nr:hypothetical protein [Trinickia symbiotica]